MGLPVSASVVGVLVLTAVGAFGAALFEDLHVVKMPKRAHGYRGIMGDFLQFKDGSLLMAYAHGGIKAVTSADKGKTWGKPFQLIPNPKPPAKGCYECPSFLRLKNGNIMVSYIYRGLPRKEDHPYYANNYYRISADEGKTWTEHFLLTPQPGYVLVHNDRLRMLSTGRIVATAEYKAHWPSSADHGGYVGITFFSDDGGYSWQRSANTVDLYEKQKIEVQEADIVELKDGRLLMFARTYSGHPVFAYSKDKGASWGKGAMRKDIRMPYAGLPTVKRIPTTGDLLFVWNRDGSQYTWKGTKASGRCGLATAVSTNEGKSLVHTRYIAQDPLNDFGYQCVEFIGKDLCLVGYHTRTGINVARIGIDWFYGK